MSKVTRRRGTGRSTEACMIARGCVTRFFAPRTFTSLVAVRTQVLAFLAACMSHEALLSALGAPLTRRVYRMHAALTLRRPA